MRAYERLLNYVKIHTASADDAETVPSTARQFDLARPLCDELKALGIKAEVDELNRYYTGSPHYTAIMDCYMQGYDKACALAYAAALIQQEQRQRAAQQAHREPEPTPPPVYEPTPEPPVQEPVQAQNEPKITGTFRVTGTKQQIIALRDFLRANQIAFEIVKEK